MQQDYITQLVKSAKKGKKDAFIELCNSNLKKIYNLSLRIVLNKNISEELTQNIFIQAWEEFEFFEEDQEYEPWVKNIAVNIILDEIRSDDIKKRLIKDKEITENDFNPNSPDKFERIIMLLPDLERIPFILHEIEEYTYDEISEFYEDMNTDEIKDIIRETRNTFLNLLEYENEE
jgi:RNA polymerase sigma-70 factor (ECF subfamily)